MTLTGIAVGHPQQALLWSKVATAWYSTLKNGIVTDNTRHTPEARMVCSAFHSIKAAVSQVSVLLVALPMACFFSDGS